MEFALRGFKEKTLHCAVSTTELDIKGTWTLQGRQPISDNGGAPKFINEIFENHPDIEVVAIGKKNCGKVYSR